jgi:hypothetical protein
MDHEGLARFRRGGNILESRVESDARYNSSGIRGFEQCRVGVNDPDFPALG